MPVPTGMEQIQDLSRKIIKKAGKMGRTVSMEAAGRTRLLVDQLREIYPEGETERLDGPEEEEDVLFENIVDNLKRLLKALGGKPERVAELVQTMDDTLDPLFSESNDPRLFSFLPGYYVLQTGKPKLDVTLKGQNLNYHDPHINLGGKQIRPSVNEEDKLVFSIPTKSFQPHPFRVSYTELKLTVYRQKRTWYTLGFKKENTPVEYSLVVYIMPRNLARYSIKIKKVSTSVERREGKGPLWSLRSGGRQDVRRTFSHAAETGWKFEPGSAKFVVTRPVGKIDVNITVSPDLISVEMLSDGKESQDKPFEGHLAYIEWRNTESEEEKEVVSNKYINWKDREVLTLPENTVSYLVSIVTFNGLKSNLDGKTHKADYVKVHYDLSLRRLSLTPKKTDIILGNSLQ